MVVVWFGEVSPWESKEAWFRHGYGLWKSIQKVKDGFWKFIRFNMESERDIRIWDDLWIGDSPLQDMFRNLHSLAMDPMGRVIDAFDEE